MVRFSVSSLRRNHLLFFLRIFDSAKSRGTLFGCPYCPSKFCLLSESIQHQRGGVVRRSDEVLGDQTHEPDHAPLPTLNTLTTPNAARTAHDRRAFRRHVLALPGSGAQSFTSKTVTASHSTLRSSRRAGSTLKRSWD